MIVCAAVICKCRFSVYECLLNSEVFFSGDTFTLEVPVVIRLTCDCAVADGALFPQPV